MSGTTNLTTNKAEAILQARVTVRSQADLPAPSGGVIQGADNTEYYFIAFVVLEDDVQFAFGSNTSLKTSSSFYGGLTGNTTSPDGLLFSASNNPVVIDNLTLTQNGTGDLISIASGSGFIVLRRTIMLQGDVRLLSGTGIFIEECPFLAGARLVIDSSAPTINDIRIGACNFVDNAGVEDGVFLVEDGVTISNLDISSCFITMINAGSTAFRFGTGVTITNLNIQRTRFTLFNAAGVGIKVENPDDISGAIDTSTLLGSGSLLKCAPETFGIVNINPSVTEATQCTMDDGGNAIIVDDIPFAPLVRRFTGITATLFDTVTPDVGTLQIGGVTWHDGRIYTVQEAAGIVLSVRRSDPGFVNAGSTLPITVPASGVPAGIVFIGTDMVLLIDNGASAATIQFHQGFTNGVITTITLGESAPQDLSYDGLNLIVHFISGNITVLKGVTNTVQYTIPDPTDLIVRGVHVYPNRTANTQNFFLSALDTIATEERMLTFPSPLTFDNSSRTWQITGVPGVRESSDRCSTRIRGTVEIAISIAGQFVDIVDVAGSDFWFTGQAAEKCVLEDETNGAVRWTGTRERGRTIVGQITMETGDNSERTFEAIIVIDGIQMQDSLTSGAIETNKSITTFTTNPIKVDLVAGRVIKMQIANITDTFNPEASFGALTIF